MYRSSVESSNRRGRPLGSWEDRVQEYVRERGVRVSGLGWARRECVERERWRSVCRGHSLGGRFQRELGVEALDRLTEFVKTESGVLQNVEIYTL